MADEYNGGKPQQSKIPGVTTYPDGSFSLDTQEYTPVVATGIRGYAQAMQQPEQPTRSALGEIGTGLRTGVMGHLPKMVADAAQWATDNTSPIHQWGAEVSAEREAYLNRPENKLQKEGHNAVVNAIAEGATMLASSVAPAAVAAGGVAAVAAAAGIAPVAALGTTAGLAATAIGGAAPLAMSQAQQTYEAVKEAGGSEEAAISAGRKSGAIELIGETVGTWIGGKFVGVGAKAIGLKPATATASKFVADATDQAVAKPFFKSLVTTALGEAATEATQNYLQAQVERSAGVETDPYGAAVASIAPTLGMTALLGPFGFLASRAQASRAKDVHTALRDTNPETTPTETRIQIVNELYEAAKEQGVQDADAWHDGAMQDIELGQPVRLTPEPEQGTLDMLEANRLREERQAREAEEIAQFGDTIANIEAQSAKYRQEAWRKQATPEAREMATRKAREMREFEEGRLREDGPTPPRTPPEPYTRYERYTPAPAREFVGASPDASADVEANRRSLEENRISTSEEKFKVLSGPMTETQKFAEQEAQDRDAWRQARRERREGQIEQIKAERARRARREGDITTAFSGEGVIERARGKGGFTSERSLTRELTRQGKDPNDFRIISAPDGFIAVPKPYTTSQAESDAYWGEVAKRYFPEDWTEANERDLLGAKAVLAREQGLPIQFSLRSQEEAAGELTRSQRRAIESLQASGVVRVATPAEANQILTDAGQGEALSSTGAIPQGFRLPGATQAVIIPQNIPQGRVWGVVRHEVGVHLNRLAVGDKQFERVLQSVIDRRDENSRTGKAIRDAIAAVPDSTSPEMFREEVLAYMVEKHPNTSVVRKLISWVKEKLTRLGISANILTAADITAIADRAVRGTTTHGETTAIQNEAEAQFSLVSDQIKAGQKRADQALGILANPKSAMHSAYMRWAPNILSVTPLQTMVDTFGKTTEAMKAFLGKGDQAATAQRLYDEALDALAENPTYAKAREKLLKASDARQRLLIQQYSKHTRALETSRKDIAGTSAELYSAAVDAAKKGAGVEALNKAMFTASFNRMTPWLSLEEQEWMSAGTIESANDKWNKAGMKDATGMTFAKAYKEAANAYKALDQETRKAYEAIVDHLSALRRRERNNLLAYIERASEGMPELRAQLMAQFEATFSTLQGAYMPLARFGDWRLEYVGKDGFKYVEMRNSEHERNALKELAKEVHGLTDADFIESYRDQQGKTANALPNELMQQLTTAVLGKETAGVDMENAEAVSAAREKAQGIIEDMNQIWLRWQPETAALKNSIRRQNVHGADKNMLRSYLDYVQRHASNIAWSEQGRKLQDDISQYGEVITAKNKNVRGPEGNIDLDRMVLNDLRNRVRAVREAKVSKTAAALGKISTGWYMTSPSIALVQLSQLGVLTFPRLATQYGFGKASRALSRGMAKAFNKDYVRAKMFEDAEVSAIHENIRATVTEDNRNEKIAKGKMIGERLYTDDQIRAQAAALKKRDPKAYEMLILRESMTRDLLDVSAAYEAAAMEKRTDPESAGSKIFDYAMMPMKLSELASRKATILATAELAGDKDFFATMDAVADAVDQTLYTYSSAAQGSALQGGLVRNILQFQKFRIMTGIRMGLLLYNLVKGETKDIQREAFKEFSAIMGMSALLAGTMGTPIATATFATIKLLNGLFGDDDEPIAPELTYTNWLRENLGEYWGTFAEKGALTALGGVDVSKRIGLGDIYGTSSEPPPGTHGAELAAWWATNLLGGPFFSVLSSWARGYDEIFRKGNVMRGLETASPKPIRDALKSYRVGTEGLQTSAGLRIMGDELIGPNELVLLGLGFNAVDIANAQTAYSQQYKISTQISERRGKLIRNAVRALAEDGNIDEAREDIINFNRRMPRFAINGGDINTALKTRLKGGYGLTGLRDNLVADQYEIPVFRAGR